MTEAYLKKNLNLGETKSNQEYHDPHMTIKVNPQFC